MLGNRTSQEWIEEYAQGHQHPVNRALHSIGIPMIAVSVLIAVAALFSLLVGAAALFAGLWKLAAALFVVGWVFQFIGHAYEGKPPEFMKDWRFLLVGLRWWFAKMAGRA